MFVLWAALAAVYAMDCLRLTTQRDTGALILGAITVGLAVLSWRSFQKRKARRSTPAQ